MYFAHKLEVTCRKLKLNNQFKESWPKSQKSTKKQKVKRCRNGAECDRGTSDGLTAGLHSDRCADSAHRPAIISLQRIQSKVVAEKFCLEKISSRDGDGDGDRRRDDDRTAAELIEVTNNAGIGGGVLFRCASISWFQTSIFSYQILQFL